MTEWCEQNWRCLGVEVYCISVSTMAIIIGRIGDAP